MPRPVNGSAPASRDPRPYDARRRQAAAEATRQAVLVAAHELFSTRGYAGTSVADVARAAGVAVDTVYASVGRKPRLLLAVHDLVLGEGAVPSDVRQRAYVQRVRAAPDARTKIAVYAEAMGRLLPRTAPLLDALRSAAATDDECAAVWTELSERRAANMRLLAADLRATGELRDDFTDEEVADLVWSLNGPEYFGLVSSRGRGPEEYAALLADVLTRVLLR
ncbi:TetR/AcrR family transcriptional regulator [Nocardioides dongkuii]|uniref:TetR/AcrR family transcriptional regulator n=1 Tax=Nocardioides dongkuii TaxID=2760089 RepID=UPI001FD30773|nr:TetR/AcrR family transcriptional regulator [Nocardioides dongkuii]